MGKITFNAVNKPLAVVVAAIVASVIMAVFVYGLSAGDAAVMVVVKGGVLVVGLLFAWVTVRGAQRRKTYDEDDAEIGEVSEQE